MTPHRYPFPAPFDNAVTAERELRERPAKYWRVRGERAVLALFKKVSTRVPAYRQFLKRHRINPESIRTIADFSKLPILDKENYLRAYSPKDLSWDGNLLNHYHVHSSTSGSTGEPYYFPRTKKQTEQYALMAELYLRSQYKIQDRTTLYVNCFAMGAWIGGLFTFQAIEQLAERGKYPLHIITPGLAKEEALKAIIRLGPLFEQVIIGGYPPYVKDLIDFGASEGMQWKKYNIQFVFSAEGFSEKFRNYISKEVAQKNVLRGSLNHYGTVDLGTMAYETPYAAFIRRAALADNSLFRTLFAQANRLPTFAQFVPEHFYFEDHTGSLLCSADSGFPLVRYDLKDQGGIWDFDEVQTRVEEVVPKHSQALKKEGIADTLFRLPFVYLHERSDFAVVLYGANIYPEHVRHALENDRCVKFSTGKCAIRVIENRICEPRLEVNVELKRNVPPSYGLMKEVRNEIVATLIKQNAEFRNNFTHLHQKMIPRVKLWPFSHPKYFSGRGKQQWSPA